MLKIAMSNIRGGRLAVHTGYNDSSFNQLLAKKMLGTGNYIPGIKLDISKPVRKKIL